MINNEKNSCHRELIGKWKSGSASTTKEITDQCLSYMIIPYYYSFTAPDTLHYGGACYKRVSGNSNSLIGVWKNDDIGEGEKVTFSEDGTYYSREINGDENHGTYTSTETHLTIRILRATIKIDGLNITLIRTNNYGTYHGTFEIVSPEKWILRLNDMKEEIYYKV